MVNGQGSIFLRLLKEFVRPREFTFQAIIRPETLRRRFRLVRGLLKDVPKGKLTKQTQKDLVAEIADSIAQSPVIRAFREAEEERLRGLR